MLVFFISKQEWRIRNILDDMAWNIEECDPLLFEITGSMSSSRFTS
jgi:hypothetical protein